MRHLLIIAVAALAACARTEPVEESSEELDAQALAAEEAASQARTAAASQEEAPAAASGNQWFTRTAAGSPWAGYGPPNSEAAFSVRCEGERLVFNTTEMPPSGPGDTQIEISADGFSQELSAEASEQGLPNTEASVPADAEWLSQLTSASGSLAVTVGGSDPLTVPIADPMVALIRDCGR